MTKRDYQLLADALKNVRPLFGGTSRERAIKLNQWVEDVGAIALAIQEQNPHFNSDQFLTACGVDEVN